MNLFDLSAKLTLDSSAYTAGIASAKKAVGTFGKVAAATFAAGSAAFVAFSKSAVQTGAEFDTAMSQVAATMGVTTDEIANLRDFAKQMGATTQFSAVQSAQALNYMALAGYDAEKSMKTLPSVMNLAAAGAMDLARASDMVTDAESALGLTSEQTATMVDQMAKTASKSNTSVEQLGDAMLTIGGTANIMAGGTDRLQTVLGLLADNGIKGAEAGTHLRNMLLRLSSPTKEGSDALKSLGVEVFDTSGNMRDMQVIIGDLGKAMSSLTEEQKVQAISNIFNARDLSAVNALLNTSTERWNELGSSIASAQGAAQAMAETQLDNLTGDVTLMKSAWEGVRIEFSEGIMPALRNIVQKITEWLSNPKTMKFVAEVGEKVGALVEKLMGWAEKVFPIIRQSVQNLLPIFKSVFNSVGSIVGTVASNMGKAFQKILPKIAELIGKIATAFGKVFPKVISFVKSVLPYLKSIFQTVSNIAKKALPIVVDLIKKLAPLLKNVIQVVEKVVKAVGPLLSKVLSIIGSELGEVIGWVTTFVKSLSTPLINAVNNIAKILSPVLDLLKGILDTANKLLSPVKKVLGYFGNLFGSAEEVVEKVEDVQEKIEEIDFSAIDFSPLTDAMKDNQQAALDAVDAWSQMGSEFANSYMESENEIKHIQDLYSELDRLTDAKGRVNDADLERAHFITDELSSLTDLEIEWNGNVIQSYNDISNAIENVIKKKRASTLIGIAEERANKAREDMATIQAAISDTQLDIADFDRQVEEARVNAWKKLQNYETDPVYKDLERMLTEAEKFGTITYGLGTAEQRTVEATAEAVDAIHKQYDPLHAEYQAIVDKRDRMIDAIETSRQKAESKLAKLSTAEADAYANIAEYEAAYVEYAQGNFDAVQEMLEDDVVNKWKRVVEQRKISEEERADLERDMRIKLDAYKRYNDAYLAGEAGRTREGLAYAKKQADEIVRVYEMAIIGGNEGLYKEAHALGVSFTDGFTAGIKSMAQKLAQVASDAARGAANAMRNTLQIKSPSRVTREIGQYFGEGFAEGIDDEVRAVEQSVGYMSDAAVDAFGNPISGEGAGVRATGSGRVEQLLQAILDNMGVDIVLDDGTIAGRVDRIIGQSAMRKARGGA